MRALALVLVLTLASRADAQEAQPPPPDAPLADRLQVEKATVLTPEGRRAEVEGGAWLSSSTVVATGDELQRLRGETALLKVGLVVVSAVALVATGWALAESRRADQAGR